MDMSVIEASWFEIAVQVNVNPLVNFSPISILISVPNSHPSYRQLELCWKRIMWNQLQWCRDPDGGGQLVRYSCAGKAHFLGYKRHAIGCSL